MVRRMRLEQPGKKRIKQSKAMGVMTQRDRIERADRREQDVLCRSAMRLRDASGFLRDTESR